MRNIKKRKVTIDAFVKSRIHHVLGFKIEVLGNKINYFNRHLKLNT